MPDGPAADNGIGRPSRAWLSTLGWACYLACSWTWCIGMFLPVLLVRDYGLWGFVVFAVPNVLGAAAMGWVLRRESSERLVREHYGAMAWFSLVTIAFHAFFVVWPIQLLEQIVGVDYRVARTLPIIAVLVGLLGRPRVGALVAYAISLACIGVYVARGPTPSPAEWMLTKPSSDVIWIAGVCLFGFALCPYLDLTFHRAIHANASSRDTRRAYSLGFGVLFLVMILFTLWYAPAVIADVPLRMVALAALAAHLFVQAGYTVGLHVRTLWWGSTRWGVAVAAVIALLAWALLLPPVGKIRGHVPLSMFGEEESVYRFFMGFYGLAFPAYVWICMIPKRLGHAAMRGVARAVKLLGWALAVGIAASMFWKGFVEREEWWLAPGLAVVLAIGVVIQLWMRFGRLPPPPSGGPTPAPTGPMQAE